MPSTFPSPSTIATTSSPTWPRWKSGWASWWRSPNPSTGHLLDYYREFVKQPPEQLGGIRSTVFNYLQPYTTPDLADVFCSADPTFDIKEIDEGRLITIKIPQKYQVEKKYISLLLKVQFYLHALRRYDLPAEQRDQKNLIVLVLDEAQETVLVSEDGISDYNVVDKIRGARATTINSTQSPTSYIPTMGSREKADVFFAESRQQDLFHRRRQTGIRDDCRLYWQTYDQKKNLRLVSRQAE